MQRSGRTLSQILAATAALALLAQGASGQVINVENLTDIVQEGTDNVAIIDQTGTGNVAGTELIPLFQDGFLNRLEIEQIGVNNRVGDVGEGLRQFGIAQTADIFNSILIEQSTTNNRVNEIFQRSEGTMPIGGNRLNIVQGSGADPLTGLGNNTILFVEQDQASGVPGQFAVIQQTGANNLLTLVRQIAVSGFQNLENRIDARVSGDRNATRDLRGFAAQVDVLSGQLIQEEGTEDVAANGNLMVLDISGNDNDFGIRQRGRNNEAVSILILGDSNSLGIVQDGLQNDVQLAVIEGNDNEIGLNQLGTNSIFLTMLGASSSNQLLIDQMGSNDAEVLVEGDFNEFVISQGYNAGLGGDNIATLTVTGDGNFGEVTQEGENRFSLQITGDRNNRGAGFSGPVAATELVPGIMEQRGADNQFDGQIAGDENLVSFLQDGTLNDIFLRVQGSNNEARFLQGGNGNIAELNQTGRGNRAVFLQ